MRILVNGRPHETEAATLEALLLELGLPAARVATALNGVFAPRAARGRTALAEGDAVEVLVPQQGG